MADAPLTLMAVHAHPDDEAIGTGATLALYAAQGVRTVLVTCTDGAVGEIVDPTVAHPNNLAEVRAEELRAACAILGVADLHWLGYRDSGMMGTPENDDPRSFWRADLDEATGRLVALIRQHRPQVVVTYDENGFYGHPDHIQANRVTVAAFHAAGDPTRYPAQGLAPWAPSKLYYTAVPVSRVLDLGRRLHELNIEAPFSADPEALDFGTPDEQIVATIDARAYAQRKREALAVHRSQVLDTHFFLALPPPVWEEAMGVEYYERPICTVPAPAQEDDLFAGLRG
ncbi:MAG TPA: N-acetyl-1-D-myo-inositol-2-amino-2-deoxy-alpha-D-glucopyranoside deacetylase [Chloroflexota bacterium]|nr:N-acetyl-1-D-myo-inositol-2-amino-2-deoxy-alpha-D-glucopyranoside deacetylase [Chloroflexota bacterium]